MKHRNKICYGELNSRQKENFNFHKIAARMADYGYNCMRLNDDWQGADFIACHIDGDEFLKIQQKGRLTVNYPKYLGKSIYIAFIENEECFVYPHDELAELILKMSNIRETAAWEKSQAYDWPRVPKWIKPHLSMFKI